MLEKKLQEELNRYKAINNYGKRLIVEQAPPPPADPTAGATPTSGDTTTPPIDPATDPTAAGSTPPPTDDTAMGGEPPVDPTMGGTGDTTEEIDITDLVNMTKNIKNDLENSKQDNGAVIGKMDDVFTKLSGLEAKLGEMDAVIAKIDQLGIQVQQMKPETPVEKLEMRSLDSYPFSQKPSDFFSQKQAEMRATGKNEYILTKDDVNNYSPEEVKTSFNPNDDDDEQKDGYRF